MLFRVCDFCWPTYKRARHICRQDGCISEFCEDCNRYQGFCSKCAKYNSQNDQ